jgi:hypothetical protein
MDVEDPPSPPSENEGADLRPPINPLIRQLAEELADSDDPDHALIADFLVADTSTEEATTEQEVEHGHEQEVQPQFDPSAAGLKEISNLGKFTVSSYKQGNGVAELRSDDLKQYWQ